MKKIFAIILPSVILLPLLIVSAQAGQGSPSGGSGGQGSVPTPTPAIQVGINNPFSGAGDCTAQGADCLYNFVQTLVTKLVLPIGAIIAVCMFILTGFKFVSAQGNPGAIKQAKASLLYTSIGTAILLGAWVIAEVIKATVNELTTAANN